MPFSNTEGTPILNILMNITEDSNRLRFVSFEKVIVHVIPAFTVILYKQFPIEWQVIICPLYSFYVIPKMYSNFQIAYKNR